MRVLNLVTTADSPIFGQQVAILRQQGVDATTLAVPGEHRATEDGVSSRSVSDYLRLYPRALRESFGAYDLLHANYGLTLPAALAQPSLPVVATLYGSDLMGRYGRQVAWLARRADAVIVRTDEMAEIVGTEAHVIPHGVDLDLFRPMPRRPACRAVGWDEEGTNVLFPYPPTRDVKDYPRAKRVVAAARRELGEPIELQTLSGVPHERMPLYYNAADALLLTSRREGSPNSVKEALACNLPVVSTDVGDVGDLVAGVEHSHVAETNSTLADGLVVAVEQGPATSGRTAVEPLRLERMGERIRGLYESVT